MEKKLTRNNLGKFMTRSLLAFLLAAFFVSGLPAGAQAEYPDKPIVIIVHAKPGGAIDLTARMISKVARNFTKAPLVIENRYGGSGAVAMRAVLGKKPDGYHLLAFPATFISTVKVTRSKIGMDDYRFLACMVEAPEALITNRNSDVVTLEDIIRDAKAKNGRQIWVGPGVGSLDHLMAVKTWDKLGISATWLPYDGGGEAVAALMGGHGTVYVGNPEDVRGRPDLKIAAVSSPNRLQRFPDSPTLLESGYDLPKEIMWRGFAVHKDTPDDICNWLTDLLHKVSTDAEWIEFVAFNSAENVFYEREEFTALVNRDSEESVKYLRMANILAGEPDQQARKKRLMGWISIPLVFLGLFLVIRIGRKKITGQTSIATFTLALALLFLFYAFSFPPPTNDQKVSAASIPIIWALVLIAFSLLQIIGGIKSPEENSRGRIGLVLMMIVLMTLFVTLMPIAGFFLSMLILLVGGIYAMGYRRHLTVGLLTVGMISFCWFIFIKTLGLPLPWGSIFG
jgi:putative tricarboxylic transport membrane protein